MNLSFTTIIIALSLCWWLKNIARHPFIILIILILCFNSKTIEQVDNVDIVDNNTISLIIKNNPKTLKAYILDKNKNIIDFNTANFRNLIEQSSKKYFSHKILPLNQRDKCYADLDIGSYSFLIFTQYEECLKLRGPFMDFLIKSIKILCFIWPLTCLILAIYALLFALISNSTKNTNEDEQSILDKYEKDCENKINSSVELEQTTKQ